MPSFGHPDAAHRNADSGKAIPYAVPEDPDEDPPLKLVLPDFGNSGLSGTAVVSFLRCRRGGPWS